VTTEDKYRDVCAAALHLLGLQGDLVVQRHTGREARDKTDYWYAAQLSLAAKLTAAGWGAGAINERELRESREAFQKQWMSERPKRTLSDKTDGRKSTLFNR
jgi:hypothetical protein